MPVGRLTPEETEWVRTQRAAQGLPPKIEDPDTLDAIAAIFIQARRDQTHTQHQDAS